MLHRQLGSAPLQSRCSQRCRPLGPKMISPEQQRPLSRSMAIQTEAPASPDASAALSGTASSSGRGPPLGALEGGRIVASPQQPVSLTTALIARATNKTLDEVRRRAHAAHNVGLAPSRPAAGRSAGARC
jgi:hypothetical protein